jgi:dephospho-CoA kinase
MIKGVLLTGAPGVGKTSVAIELGHQLGKDDVPTAVIELDWFGWVLGKTVDVERLIRDGLAAVWPNLRGEGVTNLVLSRMLNRTEDIDSLRQTLDDVSLTIVRVIASREMVEERLRARDSGAELKDHLAESRSMTALLDQAEIEDFRIANEGSVSSTASQLRTRLGW